MPCTGSTSGRERDFLSFAVPTITGEVRRYFRDYAWTVRTPRSVKERYLTVGAAVPVLSQGLGRAPTAGELAGYLGMGRDQVVEALAAQGSYQPASLDQTLTDGGDTALARVLGRVDDELDRVEVRHLVRDLVSSLPERERRILGMRFIEVGR